MENLADTSESPIPSIEQKAKRSINWIFHLFIQISMGEKHFLLLKLKKLMEN